MIEKYLLIVEGKEDEKSIFESVFLHCGYHIIRSENKLSKGAIFEISETLFELDNKNVVLIEGPANRIHDILINLSPNYEDDIDNIDVEALFDYRSNEFRGIFWIYDVDHNDNDDIVRMMSKFCDESGNGLLLLSSPCIEVLADYDDKRVLKCNHLKEYKAILNDYWNRNNYNNSIDYISKNIKDSLLYYLSKNEIDFKDDNVMNHPQEIIDFINKHNIRDNEKKYVCYRYFSTVVYVVIGFIAGLTKAISNTDLIKQFINEHL